MNISWKCIKYMKYYFYQLFLNSQNFKSYSTKRHMSILQQLLYSINKTWKQDYVQDQNLVLQSHLNNSVLFIFECEAIFFSTVLIKKATNSKLWSGMLLQWLHFIPFMFRTKSCSTKSQTNLHYDSLPFSLTSASYSQTL